MLLADANELPKAGLQKQLRGVPGQGTDLCATDPLNRASKERKACRLAAGCEGIASRAPFAGSHARAYVHPFWKTRLPVTASARRMFLESTPSSGVRGGGVFASAVPGGPVAKQPPRAGRLPGSPCQRLVLGHLRPGKRGTSAQWLSGTNSCSLFLGVAAPLKTVFPKKGFPFFSPGSLNNRVSVLPPPKRGTFRRPLHTLLTRAPGTDVWGRVRPRSTPALVSIRILLIETPR